MDNKVAVVFDTNFIYAKSSQMEDILCMLRKEYEVYITQMSIDERKEQQCRDFEKGYRDTVEYFSKFTYVFGTYNLIDIEEALKKLREGLQKNMKLYLQNI